MVFWTSVGWGRRRKPLDRRKNNQLQPKKEESMFPLIYVLYGPQRTPPSPRPSLTFPNSLSMLQAKEQSVKPEQGKMLTRTHQLWKSLAMSRQVHGLQQRSIGALIKSVILCTVTKRVHLFDWGSAQYMPSILFRQWSRALAAAALYFPARNTVPRR